MQVNLITLPCDQIQLQKYFKTVAHVEVYTVYAGFFACQKICEKW